VPAVHYEVDTAAHWGPTRAGIHSQLYAKDARRAAGTAENLPAEDSSVSAVAKRYQERQAREKDHAKVEESREEACDGEEEAFDGEDLVVEVLRAFSDSS
jgi:hypothetical protein